MGKGGEESGLERGSRMVGKEGKVRGNEEKKGREGQTPPEQKFWLRP